MKIKRFSIIGFVSLIIAASLFLYSCESILDVPAKGALSIETINTPGGVEAALIGAYAGLMMHNHANDYYHWADVRGGLAHKGSNSGDQPPANAFEQPHNMTSNNAYLNTEWIRLYEANSRVSTVLQLVDATEELSEQDRIRFISAARFLRGHIYFELTRKFKNVPWIDETHETVDDFVQPNPEAVWGKIEEDFLYAVNNLPETQPRNAEPNSWAAKVYLGKVYLYQNKHAEAKAMFDDVIANGVNNHGIQYALTENFNENFNSTTEFNSEWIWDLQHTADDAAGANPAGFSLKTYPYSPHPLRGWGFFQPSHSFVNAFQVDDNGLPFHDNWNDNPLNHDTGYSSIDASWEQDQRPVDPRLDWSVVRRGQPNHDWGPFAGQIYIRDQSWGGPYHVQKVIYFRSQQAESTISQDPARHNINHKFIRFADVLLMAAEAEIELGNLEAARDYVNQIRQRARDSERPNNSLNEAYAVDVVDNEADMLASDASQWEWVVRTDRNSTFLLVNPGANDIDNWIEYEIANYEVGLYENPWSSVDEARKAVRFERKLELGLEGHWFYDLVRWGIAEEYLNDYYAYEGNINNSVANSVFTEGRDEIYPIPFRQIELMVKEGEAVLQQNPNY